VDAPGRVYLHKRLTTPADPAAQVVHGSTIATNALLERRGAATALITTAGFADVLEIGRQNRPELVALGAAPPAAPGAAPGVSSWPSASAPKAQCSSPSTRRPSAT
jgi:hypothetical protein